jgi:CDP-diacylglycerol---glycerol-3-phosphate 3-phosphatidyltransferase
LTPPQGFPPYEDVVDLVSSLFLLSLLVMMVGGYAVRSYLVGRTRQHRLETGEGKLIGRPLMEAGYWFLAPVTDLLMAIGATPNAVTLVSLLPGLGAGIAIATGHFGLGALLAITSALCDIFDGALARRLGTSSDVGELYDAAVDRYTEFFVIAGLVVHYRANISLVLLALAALLGTYMISYSTAKAEALHLTAPRGMMRRSERTFYICTGLTFTPVIALALPADLAARTEIHDLPLLVPLALVAILGNISAVIRFRTIARMARQLTEVPKTAARTTGPAGTTGHAASRASAH